MERPDLSAAGTILWLAISSLCALAAPAAADPAELDSLSEAEFQDTSRVHVELGARTDVTNETYYEDAFVDTTFLGRQLVNTPEQRWAGVLVTTWNGTRADRDTRYSLLTEVEAGDLLQRGYAGLQWKSGLLEDWSWSLDPTIEYRHDQTFGRDMGEWRATVNGRARRAFADGLSSAELGLRGDLLRASGEGSEFLLDRNGAGLTAALDHLGETGSEWRLDYLLAARSFPDSSERDHLEHELHARLHSVGEGGRPTLTLETIAVRRSTFETVSVSRDNYWTLESDLIARFGSGPWPITATVGGQLFRYDQQDSILFFNYSVGRASAALRWEPDGRWSFALGPRAEVLDTELDPGERYWELGGAFEAERLGAHSWWNAELTSGWREYDSTPAAGPHTPPLHSSFSFEELEVTADQPLAAGLRFRLLAGLRWEQHEDPAQDASSLYLTSELRWAR